MNFILWFSRKLRLKDNANNANTLGLAIAVIGIALSTIILEGTVAIVSGFKNQIKERVMSFDSQISVLPHYDQYLGEQSEYISADSAINAILARELPQGATASLKMARPVLLKTDSNFQALYLNAHSIDFPYKLIRDNIVDGQFPDFGNPEARNQVVASQATLQKLGLNVGDQVLGYFFINEAVKTRKLTIAASYSTGFAEYDNTIAFASLPLLQQLAGIDSLSATSIAINGLPEKDIPVMAAELQTTLLKSYQNGQLHEFLPVDNVTHTGAQYFNWLALLDTNVNVIFILMACVAGFTLISCMFILILNRIATIGLLRALGTTKRQIRLIFASMALKPVALGLIIGNCIGLPLLWAQQHHPFLRLDPEMYYLPYVPVELHWSSILALNVAICVVAWLIVLLPARSAAAVSPAATLRFE